jgi:sRNA-binding carbon storage regulator CsrA
MGVLAMLILSRRLGESLVIDGQIVVRIAVIGANFVDIGLSQVDGIPIGVVTLVQNTSTPIAQGVRGVVIELRGGRVRMGLEYPEGVAITRTAGERGM